MITMDQYDRNYLELISQVYTNKKGHIQRLVTAQLGGLLTVTAPNHTTEFQDMFSRFNFVKVSYSSSRNTIDVDETRPPLLVNCC